MYESIAKQLNDKKHMLILLIEHWNYESHSAFPYVVMSQIWSKIYFSSHPSERL